MFLNKQEARKIKNVMKTLILGLGNPILGDDAIGWMVAQKVYERVKGAVVFLELASVGGIYILDILSGYNRVLIVDAAKTGKNKIGTLFQVEIRKEDIKPSFCMMHQIDIFQVLDMGMKLKLDMPEVISLYGIEVKNCQNYSEQISSCVKAAIPQIVNQICFDLE